MTLVRRNIPISRPLFGPEELTAVQKPLESGWVVQGPYVLEFEDKFSRFIGVTHAAAASSCTTALHLAVAALDLKPGDEVIVPSFTWVATANVVEYMGATPIFCDIDLRTYNLEAATIERLVGPKTVGIIAVHMFGLAADMNPIMKLAAARGLWVIEDAACGFGALYHDRHVGGFGDVGCFSFHPRKAITTGEGGMVVTASSELDARVRSLRDHGASRATAGGGETAASYLLPEYDSLGYNYRLTDLQAAVGSAQMDRAEWILDERRRLAAVYDTRLADVDWLQRPTTPEGYVHGYQSYVCLFGAEQADLPRAEELHRRRNATMAAMEERGVATRQGTHAPVLLGYYARRYGLRAEQFPNGYLADRLSLALPLYPGMSDEDVEYVVDALRESHPG